MKIEKEILLASDGFYYDGVPRQGSYTLVTPNTDEYVVSKDTDLMFKEIEAILIFSQVIVVSIAVICILKGLINSINNKKISSSKNDLNAESNITENTPPKATLPYYIISIIFFVGYGIINIIRGFITNIM